MPIRNFSKNHKIWMSRIIFLFVIPLIFGCADSPKVEGQGKAPLSRQLKIRISDTLKKYKNFSSFRSDTLAYLSENFVSRKAVYLNRQLAVLLNDLEIPVITYTLAPIDTKNINELQSLGLKFEPDVTVLRKYDEKAVPNKLLVKLKEPVAYELGQKIMAKSRGVWNSDAEDFFKTLKVAEIMVTEY